MPFSMASVLARFAPPASEVAAAMKAAIEGEDRSTDPKPLSGRIAKGGFRRWEAAKTNRTNQAHWQDAHQRPINADLVTDLATLRARCTYEALNNPIVDGVIMTHQTDLVGKHGPRLNVVSDDPSYNSALEEVWAEWWSMPDMARELSGVELLKTWVYLWWTKGEHLLKLAYDSSVSSGSIALRIQNIDPERLNTDPAKAGNPRVVLGVVRDQVGRPIGYQIARPSDNYWFAWANQYDEFTVDEIIHQFRKIEPDQARGFPWLASALPTIADLRDYDSYELDAAKLAASQGVVWYTDHPDAPFMLVNESETIERNTHRTGPPGWKPMMVDPAHPSRQYTEFRTERLRELGRAVAMPLMKILLGSEKHNFSSARMDNQNYRLSLEAIQGWTERMTLNRLVDEVAREAGLLRRNGRFLLPRRPNRVSYEWTWQKQPHVDPEKEAKADAIRLRNGTLSYRDALAKEGMDEDAVIASRAETERKLAQAGLPSVYETTGDNLNDNNSEGDANAEPSGAATTA
ncbi:MAG TPA: phage portal protein [Planctomycetaceae bacterium]|nr:phage portal protein [Planctomycetaceae bacterium]